MSPELFPKSSSAIFSECGRYRYRLDREGPGEGSTAVIMVNPSTADAEQDDPTIRRVRGFGAMHGWGRILVGNLFAYRATDIRNLAGVADPVGPDNDAQLRKITEIADRLIVAWGPVTKLPPKLRGRWRDVWLKLPAGLPVLSIGEPAKCGHPKHPLMLAYASPLIPYQPPL